MIMQYTRAVIGIPNKDGGAGGLDVLTFLLIQYFNNISCMRIFIPREISLSYFPYNILTIYYNIFFYLILLQETPCSFVRYVFTQSYAKTHKFNVWVCVLDGGGKIWDFPEKDRICGIFWMGEYSFLDFWVIF